MKLKLCWFIVISSLTILFCGLNACSKKQPNNGVNLEEVGIEFSDYYKQYDDLKSCRIYYAFDMEEDLEKIKGYWNDLYKDGISESVGY